ncbi:hypothetical protein SAMN05421736_101997 [Evansella caseinilytica]|uniref:NIPSNAP protein n=1 Tax=Evansella caseinilytica TaxID=1503961 RepID=A0A1H3J251_9BACI|nr:hypothetical protein [Evansella caseinilytica]SDY33887.1 hypothetical protein SAMN05421736_101997 [Evansella caseinilytica]
MSQPVQVFMEYKIKEDKVGHYEEAMPAILRKLEEYEASQIHWYGAADQQRLYVEMYTVPTMAHYHEIKNLRREATNPFFGKLAHYIDGGLEKLHCWAFIQRL